MKKRLTRYLIWLGLALAVLMPFWNFFRAVSHEWFTNPMFSFGVLIPLISLYLVSVELSANRDLQMQWSYWGLPLILVGCVLHVMATLSGILLLSGVALTVVLIGMVAFLWGGKQAKLLTPPLSLLMFMVPWPPYTIGN